MTCVFFKNYGLLLLKNSLFCNERYQFKILPVVKTIRTGFPMVTNIDFLGQFLLSGENN